MPGEPATRSELRQLREEMRRDLRELEHRLERSDLERRAARWDSTPWWLYYSVFLSQGVVTLVIVAAASKPG